MRASIQRQFGLIALLLVAVFAMPAIAHADSDQVMTIDGAVVRVRVVGGKTYISVRSGTLHLKYADGSDMATIPAGTALMVGGLEGAPTVSGGALQLGEVGRNFKVALSENSPRLLIKYPDDNGVKTLKPGKTVTLKLKQTKLFASHFNLGARHTSWQTSSRLTSFMDRHELSASR